ncbi:glucose-6-phosphate isomerase [Asticcacaulis excentricus]|uniref:Glucose-6-phosphate isomerase n=1 Tax=Asticcacaulis excentricus (strain ATCC 15261 / DSM 4724 / KCTC 12464 / NCIMB 9791 / VKM B-1370 / CB 48) TaxID=573065 RepID=E8RLT2_ASTEC|nr:glucose-6-phosphate isomerase [Asticcacaulis excentricus]ADU13751.1 Glucose-6-phosphate isomerase [Asticcacaulis excentricus CB 48]
MSLSEAFTALKTQAAIDAKTPIVAHFEYEADRLGTQSLSVAGLYVDVSKQSWSDAGFQAALKLFEAADLPAARERMWTGQAINVSENRAVLHVALRDSDGENARLRGAEITADVKTARDAMKAYADGIRSGQIVGATGKPFKTILHIGIGGSDLGPRLVWQALTPLKPQIDIRFVANVDGSELALNTADLDPAETLVIAVSKTFTTQETLANFLAAREWLIAGLGEEAASKHLAAVSAAPAKTSAYGIPEDRVFGFKDWVGGRYSLWSAVSLSVIIAAGYDVYERLLAGAYEMDQHFLTAPFEKNAPLLLAAAQVFNRIGLDRPSRAVIPYAHRLRRLAAFLQQLEMESNGKRTDGYGQLLPTKTCPVVFGDEGTNAQHAFFQMLHQSEDIVPLELIAVKSNPEAPLDMQQKLLSNVIAQGEAFMVGKSLQTAEAECHAAGFDAEKTAIIAPQKVCPGNKPSTLVLLEALTPETLGALLALYEHKTFAEGIVMGLNSFDQWGVELGKTLANAVLEDITGTSIKAHDPSTTAAISKVK